MICVILSVVVVAERHLKARPKKNVVTFSVRLPRELIAEFRAACAAELGAMPYGSGRGGPVGHGRDLASRVVIERLVRAYIAAQQQPK